MSREPAKDRMIEYLPWYYQASKVMETILSAQGQEIDALYESLDQSLDQFFVSTATWGLSRWEELLGLPINENLAVDERRQRVLAKRRGVSQPLLVILQAIAPELEARFGGDVIPFVRPIEHNASEYDFGLLVPTLEIRKPAHKAYSFQLLPPDQSSGYTVYGNHNAGRGKVALQPEAGAVYAGRWPRWNTTGQAEAARVTSMAVAITGTCAFPLAGVSVGNVSRASAAVKTTCRRGVYVFPRAGMQASGAVPFGTAGTALRSVAELAGSILGGTCIFRRCGALHAGEVAA